ncbi:MAG: hypothetical protein WD069_18480 [Planctomycetales bacterium]
MKIVLQHLMLASLLLAGCVPSLNPVYTEKDVTFDRALLGRWKQKDSTATWHFTKHGDNAYHLSYADEDGRTGRFVVHLTRIGDATFMDLFPEKTNVETSAFYQFHLIPIHTVYLVETIDAEPKFAAIDFEWLDEHLAANPQAVPFVTFDGRKLITASTDDLRKFVSENRDHFTSRFELEHAGE